MLCPLCHPTSLLFLIGDLCAKMFVELLSSLSITDPLSNLPIQTKVLNLLYNAHAKQFNTIVARTLCLPIAREKNPGDFEMEMANFETEN